MFVKRDDQVKGLTRLLSLAVGILTLMESVARQSLQQQGKKVAGLYQDSARKETDTPTSERLLRAFAKITLTQIYLPDKIVYHVTPLNPVQQTILALLIFIPLSLLYTLETNIQRFHKKHSLIRSQKSLLFVLCSSHNIQDLTRTRSFGGLFPLLPEVGAMHDLRTRPQAA